MSRPSLLRIVVLRVALTVLGAFAVVSAWSYVGWWRTLHAALDDGLRAAARGEAAAPAPMPIGGEASRAVVVRAPSGAAVQASSAAARTLPLDSAAFRRALRGEAVLVNESWEGRAMRTLYRPLPAGTLDAPVDGVLQVSASMEPIHDAMHRMAWQLVLAGGLATLAAIVGACILTRGALASIRAVADEARALHAGTAGQRIHVETPVRESEELVQVLNGLLARLDRASDWQRRLISDLGHDIRTPITVLRASVEGALLAERSPERYREVLASTLEETDRLALISDALIMLARFQTGALQPHRGRVDLGALARQAVERAQARDAMVRLQVEVPEAVLVADRRMLGLALEELVHNALVHNPPATPVLVRVTGDADAVTLVVEDAGRGVDPEVLPHLFELGFRTDQARGRAGGAGLGLTVVAAITAVHGGRVEAAPLAPTGLRVSLTVPRSPGALAAPRPPMAIGDGALLAAAPPILPAPAVRAPAPA